MSAGILSGGVKALPTHRYSWRHAAWPAYLQFLKRTDWPILVGPWRGEVGFEVLYWIPFLEYLKSEGIAAERLIPITRGGAAVWYGTPTGLELFAMRTPQQVRIATRIQHAQTSLLKQDAVIAFDRAILKDAAATLGVTRYHTLHPAWMYHLLAPYWTGITGAEWIRARTRVPVIPAPPLPDGLILPETFVAVRFYSRETWPLNQKLVGQASEAIVRQLAAQSPVILLHTDVVPDDHMDIKLPAIDNVLTLASLTPLLPETQLAVQSAILARAQGFVGTYGGLAQLALRLGKPSVTFYHDWRATSMAHRALSDLLAVQYGVPFQVQRLAEIPLLKAVLPEAVVRLPQPVEGRQLTPA